MYCTTTFEHPAISHPYILRVAVKDVNDTMGDNRLFLFRNVFGIRSRFSIQSRDHPSQKERMEAIKMAQAEIKSIIAERGVVQALTKTIQPCC